MLQIMQKTLSRNRGSVNWNIGPYLNGEGDKKKIAKI